MIDLSGAIGIVKKQFPHNIISTICEFEDFFTLTLTNTKQQVLMDSCIGVYKDDGKMFGFNPMNFDKSVLEKRKVIKQ